MTKWLVWSMLSKCFILTFFCCNNLINKNRSFWVTFEKPASLAPVVRMQGRMKTGMTIVDFGRDCTGRVLYTRYIQQVSLHTFKGFTLNANKKESQIYQTARWNTVGAQWASSKCCHFSMLLKHIDFLRVYFCGLSFEATFHLLSPWHKTDKDGAKNFRCWLKIGLKNSSDNVTRTVHCCHNLS